MVINWQDTGKDFSGSNRRNKGTVSKAISRKRNRPESHGESGWQGEGQMFLTFSLATLNSKNSNSTIPQSMKKKFNKRKFFYFLYNKSDQTIHPKFKTMLIPEKESDAVLL